MSNTEAIIRHALAQNVAITLVVNKIDRLILELRIPPSDAFFKIKATIEEVNNVIAYVPFWLFTSCRNSNSNRSGISNDPDLRLSPEKGNVAFASSDMGYCFTLKSFADLYAETYGTSFVID